MIEEPLYNKEQEYLLEIRPAERRDLALTNGITESTNRIELVVEEGSDALVIEKHIGRKNGLEIARREIDILKYLNSKQTETIFPKLASPEVHRDEDGIPTIYIYMDPNYIPLAGDSTFFREMLSDENPRKLEKAVVSIREMHENGVCHGDLHLNNIGETTPKNFGQETRLMIIDFDLGKRASYLYPEDMEEDLARFAENIFFNFKGSERLTIREKLLKIIENHYGDTISLDRLRKKI